MKFLIGMLIWEALSITGLLISKPLHEAEENDEREGYRWTGAVIIFGGLIVVGTAVLLVALTRLTSNPQLLWLSFGWAVTYAAALRIEVMNRRENSGYKPNVEPLFPIAVVIFLGLFLFSLIE